MTISTVVNFDCRTEAWLAMLFALVRDLRPLQWAVTGYEVTNHLVPCISVGSTALVLADGRWIMDVGRVDIS